MADWKKLKKEYIKGGISYRQLAKKYGVPLGTLTRIARRDNWVGLRKQAEDKAATKIVEAVSEESAKIGADVYAAADLLLRKLTDAVDNDMPINAQDMRQYTAALRDLKDIKNIRSDADLREQEARIAKLRKEVEASEQDTAKEIKVVFDAGPEEWNE